MPLKPGKNFVKIAEGGTKPFFLATSLDNNKYGYWSTRRQREQLYVTLSASSPNPQGLYLEVDYEEDWLKSLSSGDTPSPSCIKRTMSHTLNGSSRTA